MKAKIGLFLSVGVFVGALFSVPFAGAQQKQALIPQANVSYDLSRETVLQGTVVSFSPASKVAPVGARVTLQTASGPIDVHLGSASLLKQSDIFLAPGDSVRIVGQNESMANGNIFVARVLQKGTQSVTLRNSKGIPLSSKRTASVSTAHLRKGVAQ